MASPQKRIASGDQVRAVIGVPVYNGVRRGHLAEAVTSLLGQTCASVRFVFLDDCSDDSTPEAIVSLAGGDPRVTVERNRHRIGLVRNWRRAFRRARELWPGAAYFAWGSDHDRWHRSWLEILVAELDAHPNAAMAYSRFVRIDEHGSEVTDPWPRSMRRSAPLLQRWSKVGAGSLVYGLFRSDLLEKAGVFPLVHQPDLYLMVELSLYGELRMVPEILWYRRERGDAGPGHSRGVPRSPRIEERWWRRVGRAFTVGEPSRQLRRMFPAGVPLHLRLDPWLQHVVLLFWRLAVLGRGRPQVSRREGGRYAARLFASGFTQPALGSRPRSLQRP